MEQVTPLQAADSVSVTSVWWPLTTWASPAWLTTAPVVPALSPVAVTSASKGADGFDTTTSQSTGTTIAGVPLALTAKVALVERLASVA